MPKAMLATALIILLVAGLVLPSVTWKIAEALHTVDASPPGGIYNSPQSVTLESTEPSATIYYTTDGSDPNSDSTQYNGTGLTIATNTVLKFMAIDYVENHSSNIVTENYEVFPIVISAEPIEGDARVDVNIVIDATFSESMNETSINTGTFLVSDQFDNSVSGIVSYNSSTNTTSFTPDSPLALVNTYVATLTTAITDSASNALNEDFTWSFATGGEIRILVNDEDSASIGGSAFTLTPDPFTLEGSLQIEDNGELDSDAEVLGEQTDGTIIIRNAGIASYLVEQTVVPEGYTQLYDDMFLNVHETAPSNILVVQNLNSNVAIEGLSFEVPRSYLNNSQFELYNGNVIVGLYEGIPGQFPDDFQEITTVDAAQFDSPRLWTPSTLQFATEPPIQSVIFFNLAASSSLTGAEIIDLFDIPTYPHPTEAVSNQSIYQVTPFVIPYEESNNNFVLTPVISKIFPGMTIRMDQASFVESELAKVERMNMTFNTYGNNVGFSFGISDTPPPGTPDPPLDAPALFLDVGFVGDIDFSDPSAFQSTPKIDILVNKTLPGFPELPNGCPDFKLLFFDGTNWTEVQKLEPTGNFTDFCPFTLEPEHFSKFGVGGVRGQSSSTESVLPLAGHHGGGGGSASIQQVTSGTDIESEFKFASGSVIVTFDTIESGSGQLKISTSDITKLTGMFDEIVTQNGEQVGLVQSDGSTFSTSGKIFDIDASAVKFQGMVKVTIPYDERIVQSSGSESDVRFLHYNDAKGQWEDVTIAIDREENTVTGIMNSLSPVVAAVVNEGTFAETYFEINPIGKIIIDDKSYFVDNAHNREQVSIPITIKNVQRVNQQFTLLVQIVDGDGIVRYIERQTGSLAKGQSTDISNSWTPVQEGNYTVQIFVWDDNDIPSPLSGVSVMKISIHD